MTLIKAFSSPNEPAAAMRAVSEGWHSPNLQADMENISKEQVNPALRLPATRYLPLRTKKEILK